MNLNSNPKQNFSQNTAQIKPNNDSPIILKMAKPLTLEPYI